MSSIEACSMQRGLTWRSGRKGSWLLVCMVSLALSACGQGQLSDQDKKILAQLRRNGISFDDKTARRDHGVLTIDQVSMTGSNGSTVHAKRLLIKQYDTEHPNPYVVDATLKGILVPLPDQPIPTPASGSPEKNLSTTTLAKSPAFADVLENGQLPLDGTLHYQYDEKSRRFHLEGFSLQSPKLFDLQLQLTMSDFDPVFFQQNKSMGLLKPTELLSQAAAQSKLDGASLAYSDHSLVDRTLRLFGEQQHVAPQVVRDSLKGALSMAIMSSQVQGDSFMRDALMAVSSFLEHPGILKLAAHPAEPVRMGTLQAQGEQWKRDPAALVQTLGLTLEALPPSSS